MKVLFVFDSYSGMWFRSKNTILMLFSIVSGKVIESKYEVLIEMGFLKICLLFVV